MDIYNENKKLDKLKSLVKLEKLYIENNLIANIDELNYLTGLTELKDINLKEIYLVYLIQPYNILTEIYPEK